MAGLLGRAGGPVTLTTADTILYQQLTTAGQGSDGGSCHGYTVRNDGDQNAQAGILLICVISMNNTGTTNAYVPYYPGERATFFNVTGNAIKEIHAKSSSGNLTISGGIFAQK